MIVTLLLAAVLAPDPSAPPCGPGWPGSGWWYQPAAAPGYCAQSVVIDNQYVWLNVCGPPDDAVLYPVWRSWPDLSLLGAIPKQPAWPVALTEAQRCAEIEIRGRWRGEIVPDISAWPVQPWAQHDTYLPSIRRE